MSYILQALKKSEQERELAARQDNGNSDESLNPIPEEVSVAHLLREKESSSSWTLYVLYLALLTVMVLILWQILLPSKVIEPVEKQQEARIETSAEVKNKFSKEVVDSGEVLTSQAAPIEVEQASIAVEQATIAVERAPIAVEQAPREILDQLPNIEITSHIYSTDAERRSIVVNGERLVEGDYIAANVQLTLITAQGMMIDINGWSLLVGRSRGWGQ